MKIFNCVRLQLIDKIGDLQFQGNNNMAGKKEGEERRKTRELNLSSNFDRETSKFFTVFI
jgi:hypothetical protein